MTTRTGMEVTLVVARARNGTIGVGDRLPWHLPADLRHFKQVTLGKPVVMGRRTFESIGRALPGRRNVVVTRNAHWRHDGVETAASIEEALARCAGAREVCIIGGGELYAAARAFATHAWVTEVDLEIDGDAHFAPLDPREWREVSRRRDDAGEMSFDIVEYARTVRA